ncbi:zinc finger BED domain-containing protein DAYSLEEPER-like [Helianthus annuus]|uniref:zinc finger BED domain-containing protein DAYSLEEPER-like n=1 Tax=Helianthus annuus TaxID=4232 RepID=UPI000B8FAFAC|nr:zinc finger BED domain-containing protein DAYSLEEPER-like [Helianthus annuus]
MKKNIKKQDFVTDNHNSEPVIVNDDDEDIESLNSNVPSKVRGKKRKLISKEFETFDIINTTSKKRELEMYLDEQRIDLSQNVQVLDFWKAHAYRYPNLCRMARDVLSIPVSTVALEASFSIGGRVLDQYRSTLTPQIVE